MNLIEDFGGEGDIFHFAHANAYPIKSYVSFLSEFSKTHRVIGMHQRPMWPDADPGSFVDWTILADDMIAAFEENEIKKVIGAGHSMGAIATLIASIKRPDLFSKIVLVDPVILPEQVYGMMNGLSFEEKAELNPLLKSAIKRRNEWSTKEEASDYFNSKSFFNRFSNGGKQDFLDHGIKLREDGMFTLAYPREWEARVYGTSCNPWEYLDKLKHPCLIVRAEHSDVIRSEEAWGKIKETAKGATCVQIDGAGHLIPQESPEELHKKIIEFL